MSCDSKNSRRSSQSSRSSSSGLTIWAKMSLADLAESEVSDAESMIQNYAFRKIRTFEDQILAEKFLEYLDRYFELHPEYGVEELFLKAEGEPVYQIYYLTPTGNTEIVDDDQDDGLYFDYQEMLNQLKILENSNPECEFHFREVEIDDQAEFLDLVV